MISVITHSNLKCTYRKWTLFLNGHVKVEHTYILLGHCKIIFNGLGFPKLIQRFVNHKMFVQPVSSNCKFYQIQATSTSFYDTSEVLSSVAQSQSKKIKKKYHYTMEYKRFVATPYHVWRNCMYFYTKLTFYEIINIQTLHVFYQLYHVFALKNKMSIFDVYFKEYLIFWCNSLQAKWW